MLAYDRFTERSQDSARRGFEILNRYGHNQVDTEHLLLGLLEQPEGVLPQVLVKLGAKQEQIEKPLNDVLSAAPKPETLQRGPEGQVFISERLKQVLELANAEADRLKAEHISTEHILLGILSERDTAAARILSEAGITQERVAGISGLTNT